MFDSESTIHHIESRFPDLADDLHDEINDGLLHLQIGAFSHYAQSMIDESNRDQWIKITSVFITIYSDCSSAVNNALNVSFLEHLNFKNGKSDRQWAYLEMPDKMRIAFEEMEAYNRRIHGG